MAEMFHIEEKVTQNLPLAFHWYCDFPSFSMLAGFESRLTQVFMPPLGWLSRALLLPPNTDAAAFPLSSLPQKGCATIYILHNWINNQDCTLGQKGPLVCFASGCISVSMEMGGVAKAIGKSWLLLSQGWVCFSCCGVCFFRTSLATRGWDRTWYRSHT